MVISPLHVARFSTNIDELLIRPWTSHRKIDIFVERVLSQFLELFMSSVPHLICKGFVAPMEHVFISLAVETLQEAKSLF